METAIYILAIYGAVDIVASLVLLACPRLRYKILEKIN